MMKKICLILLITSIACSREVHYQVDYDPIADPTKAKQLIVATPRIDSADFSKLKRKERRELAFEYATKKYMLQRILRKFRLDSNFENVVDTIYSAEFDDFLKGFDENTMVAFPGLSLTKSDGFTISSDEADKNYSTYYASLIVPLYQDTKELDRSSISDKTKVEGDDLMLLVDAFSEQDLNFSSEIKEMLNGMSNEYHKRWYPRTEKITKQAYITNKFEGFDKYFNNQEYEKAKEIVTPHLNSNNLTTQMQASYNMYLVCEATRDVECSNKWLSNFEKCQKELQNQWNN